MECDVPLITIAKRMRIGYQRLKRIMHKGIDDAEEAFCKYS